MPNQSQNSQNTQGKSGKASPAALGGDYYKEWMGAKKKKKDKADWFPNSPKSPTGK